MSVSRRGFLAVGGLLVADAATGCSSRGAPRADGRPPLAAASASSVSLVAAASSGSDGWTAGRAVAGRSVKGLTAARPSRLRSSGGVLNVVAHPDDDLLFLSPALLVSVSSGPVHTVFLTAGDAGRPPWYWQQRELGIRSAYAQMAGVADSWMPASSIDPVVVTLRLAGAPQVRVSFLRLPDGGHGNGFVRYGRQSLPRLWRGEQPRITAVDGSATYSRPDLIDTILAIMQAERPATVRTQDFTGTFGDGDHNDHHAAAYLTRAASDRFSTAHRLESYQDYPVAKRPANVTGALLQAKTAAFIAYAAHDRSVCVPGRRSCTRRAYPSWVRRQYRLTSH